MPKTRINVSNRLPVTVEKDRITRSSGGLVAALEGLPKDEYDTKWIGWPGAAFPIESQRQKTARKLAEEYCCVAVFLGQDQATVARVLEQNDQYELALCAGDDVTDENMFELGAPRLLTIRIGGGTTQAASSPLAGTGQISSGDQESKGIRPVEAPPI